MRWELVLLICVAFYSEFYFVQLIENMRRTDFWTNVKNILFVFRINQGFLSGDHNGQIDVGIKFMRNIECDVNEILDHDDGRLHCQWRVAGYGDLQAFRMIVSLGHQGSVQLLKVFFHGMMSIAAEKHASLIQRHTSPDPNRALIHDVYLDRYFVAWWQINAQVIDLEKENRWHLPGT